MCGIIRAFLGVVFLRSFLWVVFIVSIFMGGIFGVYFVGGNLRVYICGWYLGYLFGQFGIFHGILCGRYFLGYVFIQVGIFFWFGVWGQRLNTPLTLPSGVTMCSPSPAAHSILV